MRQDHAIETPLRLQQLLPQLSYQRHPCKYAQLRWRLPIRPSKGHCSCIFWRTRVTCVVVQATCDGLPTRSVKSDGVIILFYFETKISLSKVTSLDWTLPDSLFALHVTMWRLSLHAVTRSRAVNNQSDCNRSATPFLRTSATFFDHRWHKNSQNFHLDTSPAINELDKQT